MLQKQKKTIEKIKEKEKKLVSEQAPPKKVKKIKPDSIPMPEDNIKKLKKLRKTNKIQKKLIMKSSKFQNLRRRNYLTLITLQHLSISLKLKVLKI